MEVVAAFGKNDQLRPGDKAVEGFGVLWVNEPVPAAVNDEDRTPDEVEPVAVVIAAPLKDPAVCGYKLDQEMAPVGLPVGFGQLPGPPVPPLGPVLDGEPAFEGSHVVGVKFTTCADRKQGPDEVWPFDRQVKADDTPIAEPEDERIEDTEGVEPGGRVVCLLSKVIVREPVDVLGAAVPPLVNGVNPKFPGKQVDLGAEVEAGSAHPPVKDNDRVAATGDFVMESDAVYRQLRQRKASPARRS